MSFQWDDDAALLLIEKFHDSDVLWNPRNPDYKKRNKRLDALSQIAATFATDTSEIERKLKNLTSHYFREKKKLEESRKSDTGTEKAEEPKWFAYKALDFLRGKNKPIEAISSEDTSIIHSQKGQQDKQTITSSRKRRLNPEGDCEISDILQYLKHVSESMSIRDDASVFGDYIASKIRKMDSTTTSTVQHLIQNIIYQAEMGVYGQKPCTMVAPGYFTTSSIENPRPSTSQSFVCVKEEMEVKIDIAS